MTARPLDRRALGRTLSTLADGASEWEQTLRRGPAGRAKRIGITGPPGAGKSTLLGHLAVCRAARGRLGILAVDPTSPRSGGAILGDRVRMDELTAAADVYIRSLASRKTSDGLADNLPEMLDAMDDFDFTEVMLETVGVGQAEYAARVQVDTLVLVLLPDSGDAVQAMKAGIMELADIFVVNKSDLSGANKMAAEIRRIEAIGRHARGTWTPPVLLTGSSQPDSIQALSDAIDRHQAWLSSGDGYRTVVEERARYRLRRLLERQASKVIAQQSGEFFDMSLDCQMTKTLELVARFRREEIRSGERKSNSPESANEVRECRQRNS